MKYDAIIIGSGQAGFPLAGALPEKGWKVALAEGRWMGGTCINDGCEPTKTLVASARVAYQVQRATEFGINPGKVEIDFAKVMQRVEDRIMENRNGIGGWLESLDNLTIYREYASFEGPNSLRVGDEVIEGDRIYINTGLQPVVPPIPGLQETGYLTHTTALQLKEAPQHLIIIGGGIVGLEFAQAFKRLGIDVTIIEMAGQLVPEEDSDIAEAIKGILEDEGVTVLLNATATQVIKRDEQVVITTNNGEIVGSHILVAAGRRPNVERLNLDKAGIVTDDNGFIAVNEYLQTNLPHVWALGDVNGRGAHTHTSWNDHEIVMANINGEQRSVANRLYGHAVYIDPPLARVGMTERQVRESGRAALVATKPMQHIGRAIVKRETHGLMKFLVDAETKRFLGATILGSGGDEIIHQLITVMTADLPYTAITDAVPIHPTIAELIPTTLQGLQPLE
ncbi:MAG: mercuric reductase [Chloroflexi bacterium]|nr:MAG: mercuric reductase [Chloroflexota bacterium]